MNILKAEAGDLVEVLFLMKECVEDLNDNGFKHWNNAYPGTSYLTQAIENGKVYIYKERGIAKGMVILNDEQPVDYKGIEWKVSDDKVLYLNFLAVHPNWQKQSIAKSLLEYSELYAKENGYAAVRGDIYSGLPAADVMYSDLGFDKTGQFHTEFQAAPYFAYEKDL